jgi:hypothetical protein
MLPCVASYHVLAAAAVATELTAGLCGFEFRGDLLFQNFGYEMFSHEWIKSSIQYRCAKSVYLADHNEITHGNT